jgi:AcrR family transcriptional regulator
VARTQEQRKADTRARLLASAAELFARQGVQATSADAVADAADRTSGSVYAHFGSKEGLLLALLDEWEHQVSARMSTALVDAAPGRDRFETMWQQFAGAAGSADAEADSGGPADWLLLEHELLLQAARKPEVGAVLARRFAAGRRQMGAAFDEWAADDHGALPLPGPDVATLVLALLLGLEMQRRIDPSAVADDLAADGLALLFGRAPQPEA